MHSWRAWLYGRCVELSCCGERYTKRVRSCRHRHRSDEKLGTPAQESHGRCAAGNNRLPHSRVSRFDRPVGKVLTIFAVIYLAAMLGGTEVRAHSLKSKPAEFPWATSKPPKNVEQALDWLTVQEQLIAYGYTANQVKQLYTLPRKNDADQLSAFVESPSQTMRTGTLGIHIEPEPRPWAAGGIPVSAKPWSFDSNKYVVGSGETDKDKNKDNDTAPKK